MEPFRAMIFDFHPEAESDFNEAVEYYREIDIRLGRDFALEVRAGVKRIVKHPQAWSIVEDGVRRTLIKRFPLEFYTPSKATPFSFWR
jgi:plasmid stabilization system protein ParE